MEQLFEKQLPKSAQRTDWTKRPLSDEQIGYARNDVRYLIPLYQKLLDDLEIKTRDQWASEDCEWLLNPDLYSNQPSQAYRRIGKGARLNTGAQHALQRLCEWREQEAQKRNLPRSWVIDDDTLLYVAAHKPNSTKEIENNTKLNPKTTQRYGALLMELVRPLDTEDSLNPLWEKTVRLTDSQTDLKKQLLALLKVKALELCVPESVLASRSELDQLARGSQQLNVSKGWRHRVIGESLLELANQFAH